MLYGEEIAEFITNEWGVTMTRQKVARAISDYCKNNNIEAEELYYKAQKAIKRVYPKDIWIPAIREYISKRSEVS